MLTDDTHRTQIVVVIFVSMFGIMLCYLYRTREIKQEKKQKKKFIKLKRMNGMGSVKIISLYNGYINIFFFRFTIIMNIFYNYTHTDFCLLFFAAWFRSFRLLINPPIGKSIEHWVKRSTHHIEVARALKQLFRLSKWKKCIVVFISLYFLN